MPRLITLLLLVLITGISLQAPRLIPLGGMSDATAGILGALATAAVFIILFNVLITLRLYLDSRRSSSTDH